MEIKIGSQREPQPSTGNASEGDAIGESSTPPVSEASAGPADAPQDASVDTPPIEVPAENTVEASPAPRVPTMSAQELFPAPLAKRVSADLQAEIDEALGDLSIDELLSAPSGGTGSAQQTVELDERCVARVIKCDREYVFLNLNGQQEGIVSRRQFVEPPEPGTQLEVIPTRYLVDDNLYEVTVPGASVEVQDWSDLAEGVTVEVRVTGHNKGGLECEVNHIRGFMPISQVSLFRVDDLEPFVGQTLQCLVTEANPDRRNLVLSHRAILERQKQEDRERLIQELEVGQVREGIVRRLQNFGAFVDLGGIDGLIHVSQLSWDRMAHPSEVLEEGQNVRVRIEKIDPATGRIGLSYRDLLEDPWQDAATKYAVGSVLEGTVTKIMEFGAFVKIVPESKV